MRQQKLQLCSLQTSSRECTFYASDEEDTHRYQGVWAYQHQHLPFPTIQQLKQGYRIMHTILPAVADAVKDWAPYPSLTELMAKLHELNQNEKSETFAWFELNQIEIVKNKDRLWCIETNRDAIDNSMK